MNINMHQLVGRSHILMITFDTLRYDIACEQLDLGNTPNLANMLPEKKWQESHSPGSFTYAAHQAFFAGFFPTPAKPGRHERLFALKFTGSETTGTNTFVFDTPDIVSGLANEGYRTICIGGVGFFKKQNPLSHQLPSLFQESYWDESLGVTCHHSTRNQVDLACRLLNENQQQPIFMFINISALHQPNHFYLENAQGDSLETHAAALRYIDTELKPLFSAFEKDRDTLMILTSDHGTCYGEEGYIGHRIGHEKVWTIPYAATHRKKL
jgi:membrane-anchored protein YejM (alkaline phosphatase superfamily)